MASSSASSIVERRPDASVYWHLTAIAPEIAGQGRRHERLANGSPAPPSRGRDIRRDDDLRPQPADRQPVRATGLLVRVGPDDVPPAAGRGPVRVCPACGSARCDDAWVCADCGNRPAAHRRLPGVRAEPRHRQRGLPGRVLRGAGPAGSGQLLVPCPERPHRLGAAAVLPGGPVVPRDRLRDRLRAARASTMRIRRSSCPAARSSAPVSRSRRRACPPPSSRRWMPGRSRIERSST